MFASKHPEFLGRDGHQLSPSKQTCGQEYSLAASSNAAVPVALSFAPGADTKGLFEYES